MINASSARGQSMRVKNLRRARLRMALRISSLLILASILPMGLIHLNALIAKILCFLSIGLSIAGIVLLAAYVALDSQSREERV